MGFVCSENIEVGFSARDLWQTARQRERNQKEVSVCVFRALGLIHVLSDKETTTTDPLNNIFKGKGVKTVPDMDKSRNIIYCNI